MLLITWKFKLLNRKHHQDNPVNKTVDVKRCVFKVSKYIIWKTSLQSSAKLKGKQNNYPITLNAKYKILVLFFFFVVNIIIYALSGLLFILSNSKLVRHVFKINGIYRYPRCIRSYNICHYMCYLLISSYMENKYKMERKCNTLSGTYFS